MSGMRAEVAELKTLLQQALGGSGGGGNGRQGIIGGAISSAASYLPHLPGTASPAKSSS